MDTFPLKEEYDKICELGRGTYGTVWLWKRKRKLKTKDKKPKYVAVKSILHTSDVWLTKTRHREVYILKAVQLGCPNIIKYFGSFNDNSVTTDQTALVMEACHGDLRSLIVADRDLSDDELRCLGKQILNGLFYLHGSDGSTLILHRDLKPENILIHIPRATNLERPINWNTIQMNDIVLKITDYGLGRSVSAEGTSQFSQTKGVGTDGYIAPEVSDGKYDQFADVWSFAIIMHELAAKEKPRTKRRGFSSALSSSPKVTLSTKIKNPTLRDFLSKGLKHDRKERWSAKELLLHKFLIGETEEHTEHRGTIVDLIKANRTYRDCELKNIFLKLFLLLPLISKHRIVLQEQIIVRLNYFSGEANSVNWETINFNNVTLMFSPDSGEATLGMGQYINEAVHFLARIILQLASKDARPTFGLQPLWHSLDNFYLLSFVRRLSTFERNHEQCVEVLLQHPFLTGDTSSLRFPELVNYAHVTDTDIVIGSREGNIHVVDVSTLRPRQVVEVEKCHAEVQGITEFGQVFVVSGKEGKISVWRSDVRTNQCKQLKVISCHDGQNVRCVRMNKTFLVTYGSDFKIMVHKWISVADGDIFNEPQLIEETEMFEYYAQIKTNNTSRHHSMTLRRDELFFVDGACLKHFKLYSGYNKLPELLTKVELQVGLRCLHVFKYKAPSERVRDEKLGYFWAGTDQPAQILKVDLETHSVLLAINVFEKGFVAQLVATKRHLFCYLHEPKTTYASCICYDAADLKSASITSSASSRSAAVPFRQFVDFGEITSQLRVKEENHLFYYFRGEFRHMSLRDIETLPKTTTLRLHPEFD